MQIAKYEGMPVQWMHTISFYDFFSKKVFSHFTAVHTLIFEEQRVSYMRSQKKVALCNVMPSNIRGFAALTILNDGNEKLPFAVSGTLGSILLCSLAVKSQPKRSDAG